VEIPVDLILAELACKVGFRLKGVFVLRSLRAAGQQQGKFEIKGCPFANLLSSLKEFHNRSR
jgi:hypothetical protein